MQKDVLTSAMRNSISKVLETMFFLPLEFPETPDPDSYRPLEDQGALVTRLGFTGPFSGHIHLFIPEDLAVSLTGSFLGNEEDAVLREHVTETVKEMINMIAGNTFSFFDKHAVFDLKVPEMIPFERTQEKGIGGEGGILVLVETPDNCLAVQMVVDP